MVASEDLRLNHFRTDFTQALAELGKHLLALVGADDGAASFRHTTPECNVD